MAGAPGQITSGDEVPALIGDEARALLGTELGRRSGVVHRRDFQRWAAAVRDRNPLYFDRHHAQSLGHPDVVMPPLYLPVVPLDVVDLDGLNPDGTPTDDPAWAVRLPACSRRMAGGTRFEFLEPLYPGDVVTEVATLAALEQKRGRSGPFVLVGVDTEYRRDDMPVARATTTFIARP